MMTREADPSVRRPRQGDRMIPYHSKVVDLYLERLIDWEEFVTLRAGPGADVDAERETFRTVLETAGQGENPEAWIPVGDPIMHPQRATEIGRIPAEMFAGSNVWTIRLVVNHQNTLTRDTTYVVDLVK